MPIWALVVLGLFAVILLVFVGMVWWAAHYLRKIYYGLPSMTWLSIEDAQAAGIPESACELWLPTLHKDGLVEVRPKSDLTEKQLKRVRRSGFMRFTLNLHEFRILQGGRRGRVRPLKLLLNQFPNFDPPAAPA